MTDNSTFTHLQSIKNCFDAQTSRGRFDEYNNGDLNPDIGGALVALASMFHFSLCHSLILILILMNRYCDKLFASSVLHFCSHFHVIP